MADRPVSISPVTPTAEVFQAALSVRPLALPRDTCAGSAGECRLPVIWTPGRGWVHVVEGSAEAIECARCGAFVAVLEARYCPWCGTALDPLVRHAVRPATRRPG